MDVVLKPFNNNNLPMMPIPGFIDRFQRPYAESLGTTDNGLGWVTASREGYAPGVWGTTGNGTATMFSSGSNYHMAVVPTEHTNGTLTAALASIDESAPNRRVGLALAVESSENYVSIAPTSETDHSLRVSQNTGDGAIPIDGYGPELSAGDELSATLQGRNVVVRVNGEEVLNVQLRNTPTGRQHGFFHFSSSVAEWDMIKFTE